MGEFYKHSLLVERIGLDPSRKERCPLVRILRRYIIAYGFAFVEDEAVIVLIEPQNKTY
jgi:hypothetical protein